jgi:hypothetical protein
VADLFYSVFLLTSDVSSTRHHIVTLKSKVADWLANNGAYMGATRSFAGDNVEHYELRPFEDWQPCGHLCEFKFNDRAFAFQFREAMTPYRKVLEHEVRIIRKTPEKEGIDEYFENSILGELVSWCEGKELVQRTDFYFEGYGDSNDSEGYVFFFKDANMASLFKLTFG